MKQFIEIQTDNKIPDNSIAVCQKNRWIVVSKSVFLNDLYKKDKELSEELFIEISKKNKVISELQKQIDELNEKIKYLLGEEDENESEDEENISEN